MHQLMASPHCSAAGRLMCEEDQLQGVLTCGQIGTYFPAFPSAFTKRQNSGNSGFVPAYSGATVPDFHRVPLIVSEGA